MNRSAAIILACIAVALPRPAFAYRPFDSTDAAVAAEGEMELELGPLGFLKTGADRFLVTPGAIFSQHWKPVTLHVNGEVTLTRAGNLDLFGGTILEGPRERAVRPVVESFVEREFGAASIVSGLAGAIWQLKEGLAFDLGLRAARVDTNTALEVRAGLTWAASLWRSE